MIGYEYHVLIFKYNKDLFLHRIKDFETEFKVIRMGMRRSRLNRCRPYDSLGHHSRPTKGPQILNVQE